MMEPRRLRPPMRRFEYFAPQSLAEAIALFGEKGEGGRALAGGTDIVPQIKEGAKIPMPAYVVSLRRLPELRGIEFSERDGLRVGAGVTMAELAESPLVRERYRAPAGRGAPPPRRRYAPARRRPLSRVSRQAKRCSRRPPRRPPRRRGRSA